MKVSKVLALILTFTTACSVFATGGCSRKVSSGDETSASIEVQTSAEGPSFSWDSSEPTFFETNNLELNPIGSFEAEFGFLNEDNTKMHPCEITITENTDDCEEGRKNVVATLIMPLYVGGICFNCFDMYTGTSFVVDTVVNNISSDQNYKLIYEKTFSIGDSEIYIIRSTEIHYEEDFCVEIQTINCPVDYDGSVFLLGPINMDARLYSLDMANGSYTIAETGFMNEHYRYFMFDN